jgi:hypothetical protein
MTDRPFPSPPAPIPLHAAAGELLDYLTSAIRARDVPRVEHALRRVADNGAINVVSLARALVAAAGDSPVLDELTDAVNAGRGGTLTVTPRMGIPGAGLSLELRADGVSVQAVIAAPYHRDARRVAGVVRELRGAL